ncbi:hypothetical protein Tco_0951802 [Tanacetum coccineum]|uniref:Uncharacterized protein n=1 Tax=Tanacetum coccineum TaxID=301880 RepID=A0ABQ5DVY2_9ASTR
MESSNSNSKEREPQLTQRLVKQRDSHCMAWFEQLETHLRDLYLNSLSYAIDAFKPAFHSFFTELLENLDILEAVNHKAVITYGRLQLQSQDVQINQVQAVDDKDLNALDVGLAVTESSWTNSYKQDTSSSSGNYITHVVDADIRPVNVQVSYAEVNSNTTPDSTNMSHRGGEIDQDAEQDQVKSPLLKAEESFQSNKPCKNQESPEFREFFEINGLKAQLQDKTTLICNLKNQIKSVKEASNEAKLKKEINVFKTINIELESSVVKLPAENEKLNKENEYLKQTYKEL